MNFMNLNPVFFFFFFHSPYISIYIYSSYIYIYIQRERERERERFQILLIYIDLGFIQSKVKQGAKNIIGNLAMTFTSRANINTFAQNRAEGCNCSNLPIFIFTKVFACLGGACSHQLSVVTVRLRHHLTACVTILCLLVITIFYQSL